MSNFNRPGFNKEKQDEQDLRNKAALPLNEAILAPHPQDFVKYPYQNQADQLAGERAVAAVRSTADDLQRQKAAEATDNISVANQDTIKEKLTSPTTDVTPEIKDAIEQSAFKEAQALLSGMSPEEAPQTASDKFLSALAYFAPTIGAGLVGTALGGVEAGFASAKAGQEATKQYTDYLGTQTKNQGLTPAEKLRATTQLANTITEGKKLEFMKGREENLQGNREAKLGVDKERLKQGWVNIDLKQTMQDLEKEKLGSLSDTQNAAATKITSGVDKLGGMINYLAENPSIKSKMGVAGNAQQKLAGLFNAKDPVAHKLSQMANDFTSEKMHDLFGGNVTEGEKKIIGDNQPDMSDDIVTFERKLRNLHKLAIDHFKNSMKTLKTAQPLKAKTAEKLVESVENKPSSSALKTGKTKDGTPVIFENGKWRKQ